MLRVNSFKACLVFCGVLAYFRARSDKQSISVSTNAPEPTPTPQRACSNAVNRPAHTASHCLRFLYPTPLPDGSMPLALPPMPAPATIPTPLPDGTMP
jgi:hypothetical protein